MLWEACQDYLQSEDGQSEIRQNVLDPIRSIMYNEMYFYVWLICLYHVFLIFIVVANLFLLLRLLQHTTYTSLKHASILKTPVY
jgi:hypothetical protein